MNMLSLKVAGGCFYAFSPSTPGAEGLNIGLGKRHPQFPVKNMATS